MSCYHITMEHGHKVARPITSEAEYRQLRNNPTNIKKLQLARNGNKRAKMALLQINYNGHYPNGILKGNKLPSAAFGFDIDDKDDFERAATVLLASPDAFGLLMLEHSVNQGGHAVFRREMGKTILENQVRIARALDCEMDTNTHDVNRVYFTTNANESDLLYVHADLFNDQYEPGKVEDEAQLLEERERNGWEDVPEGAHNAQKHFKPDNGQQTTDNRLVDNRESQNSQLNYLGIEYAKIISKWWEMFNDGHTPIKSNRDVLTYELAVNLRHICGFDEALLDKVIPCYDGFSQEQKMKCIKSALSERRTQMPTRLKMVLNALRDENIDNKTFVEAVDEAQLQDDLYYFNLLPLKAMPMGVKDSLDAVDPKMAMAVLVAVTPAIGMLATGVQLMVHGLPNTLNLISYIAGKAASGKGQIDPIINAWMHDVQIQDDIYNKMEEEWRAKKRSAKNKKEQPEEPKYPVRFLTLNNTVANLAERLANTDGTHAFSFTPEADTVANKWKSSMTDFSVMIRQAYDGSRYDREARSADAVTVHIKRLLWNITMCGTPDALYRVITNYTDGLLSRLAIAKMPDNTFAPLSDTPLLLEGCAADRIIQVAALLPLMSGTLQLDKLEAKSREWVEEIRLQAVMNYDTVMADARLRDHVIAMRMTAAIILCCVAEELVRLHGFHGAQEQLKQHPNMACEMAQQFQTDEMMQVYEILADSILENDLFFFRERIENAYATIGFNNNNDRSRRGRNDNIFNRLPYEFTFQQAMAEKGAGCSTNSVTQMLKNWKNQNLVVSIGRMRFRKV